jgi:hypothetical protein
LILKCDLLVSNFCFKCANLYRYTEDEARNNILSCGAAGLGWGCHFSFQNVILQSKHKLMTAIVVHVTNLTPGSDNPRLRLQSIDLELPEGGNGRSVRLGCTS